MSLINHIRSLCFIDVEYEFKSRLHSQIGYCHMNCEEYQKTNPNIEIIHGWIIKKYTDGRIDYLLHTCIVECGVIKDITPWATPHLRGQFAIDTTITLDPEIMTEFRFLSTEFGVLPKRVANE